MAVQISKGCAERRCRKEVPIQELHHSAQNKRNSTTVVVNTVASENPDEAGRYSMDVEYGRWRRPAG